MPFVGKDSFCHSLSADKFKCICEEEFIPINGNAAEFGCKQVANCGPNSTLQIDGSCRCFQDYFEEAPGDAETSKGCHSKKT